MIRLTALFLLLSTPAMAQTLGLPGNCTAYVTVQIAECKVSHYVTCAGDPAGQQYVVDLYPSDGDFISMLDAEAQWLMAVDDYLGTVETLGPDPVDAASLTALIRDGEDSYDFTTVMEDGTVTRFVGKETMTGRVTSDGVQLLEAYNEMRAIDASGTELWRQSGTEYINPEWRIYLAGPTDWVTPTESYSTDGSPVDFVFPGEPGFLNTNATFGCDD